MGNEQACQALNKVSDGRIKWQNFSTTTCSYCSSPSNYESAEAALCAKHAEEYLAGKIVIPGPNPVFPNLGTVAKPETPPAQLSDGNNTKLYILSEGGSVGYLEMTPDMTIGEFAAMMKKMDKAEKEVKESSGYIKADCTKSNIEAME